MIAFLGREISLRSDLREDQRKEIAVIKIGSACIFDQHSGEIDYQGLERKAREIEALNASAIVVVSGAIALGKRAVGQKQAHELLGDVELQSCSLIGQAKLMELYRHAFERHVGQLLVNAQHLEKTEGIARLLSYNLQRGIITAINYNDCVDFEQLRKDNDTLAAQILQISRADKLIILGRYDGFRNLSGKLIEHVSEVTEEHYGYCTGTSNDGTGGFHSKLDAARIVLQEGKEMIIGNFEHPLEKLVEGTIKRTLFKRNR